MLANPVFNDHEVVQRSPSDYVEMSFHPKVILDAWISSMFAYEVMSKDGDIKANNEMSAATLEKYLYAQDAFKKGKELPKPIIGIGIMDNIEIGIGREVVAAAHQLSIKEIPVHMRKGQADEIKQLLKNTA